jgi:hypothetical protein
MNLKSINCASISRIGAENVNCFMSRVITAPPSFFTRPPPFKQQPVNTAAAVGSSVRLNCTAVKASRIVEWLRTAAVAWDRSLYASDEPQHITDDRFSVVRAGEGGHDLVIKNLTRDLAGQYSCRVLPDDAATFVNVVAMGNCRYARCFVKITQNRR